MSGSLSESPTVMLSAGSFSSPYEHLSQPETKRMVEHYTAYLSDNTRLIANPGLKVSIGRGHISGAPFHRPGGGGGGRSCWPGIFEVSNPACIWASASRSQKGRVCAPGELVSCDPFDGLRSPVSTGTICFRSHMQLGGFQVEGVMKRPEKTSHSIFPLE